MQHKLLDGLFLSEVNVTPEPLEGGKTLQTQPTNHLWLIDRSGSMSQLLPSLIEDLKRVTQTLKDGDSISFGYFSGQGQFRFPIKGHILNGSENKAKFCEMLDEFKRSLSLTCFSEILIESEQVVKDLSFISDRFSLYLFTDGYPVVSNYRAEVTAIEKAMRTLSPLLVGGLIIGYGDWYNRELLASMSEWVGGSYISANELESAYQALEQFSESVSDSLPKQKVAVPPCDLVYTVSEETSEIAVYSPEEGSVLVTPQSKPYSVWCLTTVEDNPQDELPELSVLYAAAYLLSQRSKVNQAQAILSAIGDSYFVSQLGLAFTNEEYTGVEEELLQAVFTKSARFTEGKNVGCLPDPNAFCLLDLLDLLTEEESWFYPNHPKFGYKRAGVKSVQKEGYPTFEANGEACSLKGLTWHETRLNLSIKAEIKGTIDLGEEAAEVGLPQLFHTSIWRNYMLVRDGVLWTTTLPVRLSQTIYYRISEYAPQCIEQATGDGDYVDTVLNLKDLPLINGAIADTVKNQGAEATGLLAYKINEQMAKIKVYKDILLSLEGAPAKIPDTFSPAQQEFLLSKGVGKSGYAPPVEKEGADDSYIAKLLVIKVAGFSSIPKISDVVSKMEADRALTGPSKIIATVLAEKGMVEKTHPEVESRISWAKGHLIYANTLLSSMRKVLQKAKFSVLLSNQWFFENREEIETAVAPMPGEPKIKVVFEKKYESVPL